MSLYNRSRAAIEARREAARRESPEGRAAAAAKAEAERLEREKRAAAARKGGDLEDRIKSGISALGGGGGGGGLVGGVAKGGGGKDVLDAKSRFTKKIMSTTVGKDKSHIILKQQFEDEAKRERDTLKVLHAFQATNPYADKGLRFDQLITKTKTGQAVVFRGTLEVAIKMFLSEEPSDFRQEVEIMRHIGRHENVLEMIDAFDDGIRRSVILPMMKQSLEALYETGRILSANEIKLYMRQIASGLAYLHSKNVAHLDLKCGNVLMDASNVCKVCDFGMAQRFTGREDVKEKGTWAFMSPEVWGRTPNSDLTKVDMYAFGMVIYELYAGQLPWNKLESFNVSWDAWSRDIRENVLAGRRPPVDTTRWDPALVGLMTRCWAQNPGDRPSAVDVLKELA